MSSLITRLSAVVLALFVAGCAGESAPTATEESSGAATGTDTAEYADEMSRRSGSTDTEGAAPAEAAAPAEGEGDAAPAEGEIAPVE